MFMIEHFQREDAMENLSFFYPIKMNRRVKGDALRFFCI
jgi:hypothetical protein